METYNLDLSKYKQLCDLTTKAVIKSKETKYGELLKDFQKVLNVNRVKNNYPPLTLPRMGKLVKPLITENKDGSKDYRRLYLLLGKCKESGELVENKRKFASEEDREKIDTYHSAFSKTFYWYIKVK